MFATDVVGWDGVGGGWAPFEGAWCGINARTAPCHAALNPDPLLTDCCNVGHHPPREEEDHLGGRGRGVGDLIGDDVENYVKIVEIVRTMMLMAAHLLWQASL